MDAEIESELRERLEVPSARASRSVRVRIGVGAAIVLVLAALIVSVLASIFTPHSTSEVLAPSNTAGTSSAVDGFVISSSEASHPAIFVHVLGAVKNPGLFELSEGARVVDAIAAAGGFAPDADPAGVNLARVVSDGEQLVAPRVGEAPAPVAKSAGSTGGDASSGQKVNLNTATDDDLEGLPHVGAAIAKRILDWRSANGRFRSVDDLMSVTGIGQKTFDDLKDLVTV